MHRICDDWGCKDCPACESIREAPQEAHEFIMSLFLREIINGLLNAADMQAPNAFYAALFA